jgi:oxygen-dependent protoporphyrinogen oxidase
MADRRIVVVGAGIAGLTAAYFLKQAGYHPIVLEKSGRAGGRMTSDLVNGFTIDCGAQFLMDSYPILTELIARNGLSKDFVPTSQYIGCVRDGTIRKINRNNILSLLSTGVVTVPGWLRFISGSIPLMIKTRSLPMNDLTAWMKYEDGNTDTWSNSYFGREVTDYIVEPIFGGLFFQPLSELSNAFSLSILSTFLYRAVKNMTTLTGGIGELPECLAAQLDMRLNTSALSMTIESAGVEVETSAGPIIADRVILAAPATVSRVLYRPTGLIEENLLGTQYSSSVVIAIALKDTFHIEEHLQDIYGAFVPKVERNVLAAIKNEALKEKSRVAGGQLMECFISGEAGKEMIDWVEEKILAAVFKELEKYFAGVSENTLFTKIYRWKEAIPLSPIGRGKNVAQYHANITGSTKVYLAGDYMGMPFTEGAAATGKWAAEAMIKNLA